MKAFLLAAGNGSRLRPLTDDLPKCLAPIQGVPLLQIWLENCRAAGVNQVLVNLHAHAQKVKEFVAAQKTGVQVVIAEEEQLLGSAGTLRQNRAFVAGEEAFLVLYADVLTNINLRRMVEFHLAKAMSATLGIYQVPDPARCGIVRVDAHNVVQNFTEKPAAPESNWAFSGVMVASPSVLNLAPAEVPADLGYQVLPKLAGRMAAYPIHEYLLDIGTPQNYTAAQSTWPGLV